MDFSGEDQKAKQIALYYAEQLQHELVQRLLMRDENVASADEAIALAQFYWDMLDRSALDAEQGVVVCGERNTQYWMERLLNIIGGYLQGCGYGAQWQSVCDEA